jgi:hypothetical protein
MVRMSSTTGVGTPVSRFCPSQTPPIVIRGSTTVLTAWVSWLVACQVTVSAAKRIPPRCETSATATCCARLTLAWTPSPTAVASRVTPSETWSRSDRVSSATLRCASSLNRPLSTAPTPSSTSAVMTVPPTPSARSR